MAEVQEEIRSELDSISNALTITRNKFLSEFQETDEKMDANLHKDISSIANCRDQMNTLKERISQLQDQEFSKRKACEQAEDEKKIVQERFDELKDEVEKKLHDKEIAEQKVQRLRENNAQQKEVLAAQEKSTTQQAVELEKSVDFFKERLGLSLKKISGERLQVIFTNLDAKEPSRVCYFCVRIKTDKTYEVTDCEPSVPDFDDLVNKLNATNNFRSFIIMLRRKFQKAV